MKISEIMTRDVQTTSPDNSLREVAGLMANLDCGAILVNSQDRLVGMITDRDIAVRAVAQGMPCDTPVSLIMSGDIRYCYDDQDVDEVARNMADIQLRRLPVVNRDKRLVGVVSLANITRAHDHGANSTLLQGVTCTH